MTDFPQTGVPPLFVSSLSMFSVGISALKDNSASAAMASSSWSTGNRAMYIPFVLPWPYLVNRVFWGNGSTLTANKDFGIYTAGGTLIYSTGSTAESGASVLQFVEPTPFLLSPGRYYMALVCSATTNHVWASASTAIYKRMWGILEQATALPLPATWTPAAASMTIVPLCGITSTTTGY